MGFHAHRDHHGQDDITQFLAGGITHHTPHRLHHIHLGIARGQEQYRIQSRDIHPFGETAHIAQYPAGMVWGRFLEPDQFGFLLAGIHAPVHMLGFANQTGLGLEFLLLLIGFHHRLEHAGDLFGTDLVNLALLGPFDDLAESHGATHG
ncbi:hypothetical protein FEMY_21000 [Ferrovum myxofaciens]|uniref:Uncharacterized protein n=1 Tax=Ferrovum myxofaciens TaxID=416213 RepID=A0A149VVW0_9PROT|nr:hypothetical protein FEMY_21000 [Ferrovum myxofaciens]